MLVIPAWLWLVVVAILAVTDYASGDFNGARGTNAPMNSAVAVAGSRFSLEGST